MATLCFSWQRCVILSSTAVCYQEKTDRTAFYIRIQLSHVITSYNKKTTTLSTHCYDDADAHMPDDNRGGLWCGNDSAKGHPPRLSLEANTEVN